MPRPKERQWPSSQSASSPSRRRNSSEQARLADARLADDEDDLPLAGPRAREGASSSAELALAPHERREPALGLDLERACAPRARPTTSQAGDRLGLALERQLAEGARLEVAAHEPVRGLGDRHRAGLGRPAAGAPPRSSCRRPRCSPCAGRCRWLPTTTSPVLRPCRTRKSIAARRRARAGSRRAPRAMPSAACTARRAWSSWAMGAPNSAMMPSPRNWLTVPS